MNIPQSSTEIIASLQRLDKLAQLATKGLAERIVMEQLYRGRMSLQRVNQATADTVVDACVSAGMDAKEAERYCSVTDTLLIQNTAFGIAILAVKKAAEIELQESGGIAPPSGQQQAMEAQITLRARTIVLTFFEQIRDKLSL